MQKSGHLATFSWKIKSNLVQFLELFHFFSGTEKFKSGTFSGKSGPVGKIKTATLHVRGWHAAKCLQLLQFHSCYVHFAVHLSIRAIYEPFPVGMARIISNSVMWQSPVRVNTFGDLVE